MDDGKPPLISLLFLFASAIFFACTETAISCVSKNKIKVASEHGDSRADCVLFELENFDWAITTILIGTNIVHLSVASIVTVWVTETWGINYVSLSTILTTIAVFFIAEMLPKSIAKKYSYSIALNCSAILKVLMIVLKPFANILTAIGEKASARGHIKSEQSVTEDEIADIIEDMTEEGTLDQQQSELISSALEFGNVTLEKVMTENKNIVAIDLYEKSENVLDFLKTQSHSRIPVYRNSPDNIVGILQTRKYMKKYMDLSSAPEIRPLVDKVFKINKKTEINDVLSLMSKHKVNMAAVTDDSGLTIGIVTVEDILEELVGDIWDESDALSQRSKK